MVLEEEEGDAEQEGGGDEQEGGGDADGGGGDEQEAGGQDAPEFMDVEESAETTSGNPLLNFAEIAVRFDKVKRYYF